MAEMTYADVVAKYGLLDQYNFLERQIEQTEQAIAEANDNPDNWNALEAILHHAQTEKLRFTRRCFWMVTSCEKLKSAIAETGIAEVNYSGAYTAVVRDEMGEFGDKYLLTIQQGAMPPFFSKELDTPEQCIAEIPVSFDWEALKWTSIEAE